MAPSSFPDTLDFRHDDHQALSHLRKESLDLFNRIHSIAEDIEFVREACTAYPKLPVLPNQRCGAWYVDPTIARQEPAYFKSTDGHFGNWSFNLRRPNLHLLSIITSEGGIILVDSTRAGKRMPDALSKTVPVWCEVINRAVRRKYPAHKSGWDTRLYCPPGTVSAQEQVQIEARLDSWVDSLTESSYMLSDLRRPLRPIWITPSTSALPTLTVRDPTFYPIICVSASKQIHEELERRSNGFVYVQGSGDDHEMWGRLGLTPQLFWDNKSLILGCNRSELPVLIKTVSANAHTSSPGDEWTVKPTPIPQVGGRISISAASDLPSPLPCSLPHHPGEAAFVLLTSTAETLPASAGADVMQLQMLGGKKDQLYFLQAILPRSTEFITRRLSQGKHVCICCQNGKDASVGIALATLHLFFDDRGAFMPSQEQQDALRHVASKQSISTRLQWIISSRPQANPSRATLKRVNEYILTSPSFRRHRTAD